MWQPRNECFQRGERMNSVILQTETYFCVTLLYKDGAGIIN